MAKKRKPSRKPAKKRKPVSSKKPKAKKAKPVRKAAKKPVKRAKPKPAKKPSMKPVKRAAKKPAKKMAKKPAKKPAKKAIRARVTIKRMPMKMPMVRVKLPSARETTRAEKISKQEQVIHRATHLAVEDIAKLTSFKLTEQELDRLSEDIEKMIKAFEGLESVIAKKRKK
jgi:hypothetical protein